MTEPRWLQNGGNSCILVQCGLNLGAAQQLPSKSICYQLSVVLAVRRSQPGRHVVAVVHGKGQLITILFLLLRGDRNKAPWHI